MMSSPGSVYLPPAPRCCTLSLEPNVPDHTTTFEDPKAMLDRIEARTSRSPTGCWIWSGATDRYGYGRISTPHGTMYVHRVRWIALNGPLPSENHQILHTCRVKSCSNPAHLMLFPPLPVTEVTL